MGTYSKWAWARWFGASPRALLTKFGGLPGAQIAPLWTYVPGSRDQGSRVLLCAHVDTVNDRAPRPKQLHWKHGQVSARKKPLGADCRAGVAMLWALRDQGHSLLLLDEEEIGGWGAAAALAQLGPETLGAHCFAVEYDRRGHREGVFYRGTESPEFRAFLAGAFPDYSWGWGSYTDIATLCPGAGLCGVNLSVGFRWEHTPRETLTLDHWETTLRDSLMVLGVRSFPTFTPTAPEPPNGRYGAYRGGSWEGVQSWDDVTVLSDSGSVLYYVAWEDCPPNFQGQSITERDLLSHWGVGLPDPGVCPDCGLSLVWVDPYHPEHCPDCGHRLPTHLIQY